MAYNTYPTPAVANAAQIQVVQNANRALSTTPTVDQDIAAVTVTSRYVSFEYHATLKLTTATAYPQVGVQLSATASLIFMTLIGVLGSAGNAYTAELSAGAASSAQVSDTAMVPNSTAAFRNYVLRGIVDFGSVGSRTIRPYLSVSTGAGNITDRWFEVSG